MGFERGGDGRDRQHGQRLPDRPGGSSRLSRRPRSISECEDIAMCDQRVDQVRHVDENEHHGDTQD